MQRKPADAIINDLFIPDSFPGGYLRVVFSGINANPGFILLSKTVFGKLTIKNQIKNEKIPGYARFPDAGSIPVG